jgi:phosphodiesterase/alkaline phosphatase D-like protein
MKRIIKTGLIIATITVFLFNAGCKRRDIPVLSTAAIGNITVASVTSGGNITDDGNADVVARGVCWGTAQNPTINDSHSTDGNGPGTFTSTVTGLTSGTAYYLRAYATNGEGTGYGSAEQFTTLGSAPVATTLDATNVTAVTATLNGSVNANYLSTVVTFEYGLTTSYGNTATPSQSPVTGNTAANVSADLIGLTAGSTYHFRVKTVNSLGTVNGDDKTFTTLGSAPAATTLTATNVLGISATLNGTVNANYVSATVTFEYGLTTSYGSTVTGIQSPVTGNTVTNVSADLSGLTAGGVTYHFRVKAVNALGTRYGDDISFVTIGDTPIAFTTESTNVTSTTATLNCLVIPNYLPTTVTFDYGLNLSYGTTVTASQSPVSGDTAVELHATISGLLPGTLYYYRVKAENALGTYYGEYIIFTTGSK